MQLKIKFENRSRKVVGIDSISALRKKISEAFGSKTENLTLVYKDSDNELISIIDDGDLTNCFEEAQDMGSPVVTIYVKSQTGAGRSNSSKKSSSSSESESDEEIDGFKAVKTKAEQEDLQKQKIELEQQKVEEEYKANLQALEAGRLEAKQTVTFAKAKEISQSKERKRQRKNEANPGHIGQGRGPIIPKITMRLKFMKRMAMKNKTQNPFVSFAGIQEALETSCPGLFVNPNLFSKVMQHSATELTTILEQNFKKVVTQEPSIIEQTKAFQDEFQRFKTDHEEVKHGHHEFQEHHSHHGHHAHRSHHGHFAKDTIEQSSITSFKNEDKAAVLQEKLKMKATIQAEKERARAEKDNEKSKRKEQKELEKQDKEAFKSKVKDLRSFFPKMNKDELKALVEQNMSLPVNELKTLINNYRIAKSTSK